MAPTSQIDDMLRFAQSLGAEELSYQGLIDSISQRIAASAAEKVAEAARELKEAGLDLDRVIPMTSSAIRSYSKLQRVQREEAAFKAEQEHLAALRRIELQLKQDQANRIGRHQPRPSGKVSPPVPAPPVAVPAP